VDKNNQSAIGNLFFKSTRFSERLAAYLQGKGYGSSSIKQENYLVRKFLNQNARLAIDIGGNKGEYTAEIRRHNPNAEIHIFEPSLTNIKKLSNRFSNDNKIVVLPFAVSDKIGSATLYADKPGSGYGSLSKRRLEHFNMSFSFKEIIKTIRFEDYWRKNLNKRVLDIVKMDIEGHELSALKGFGKAIFSTHLIQFEFGGCNIDTRTYFQDFWYFFKEHNFDIFRITPLGLQQIKKYQESDECFSTTNFIAVNRQHCVVS
jgi:FkbM family methyltransferase